MAGLEAALQRGAGVFTSYSRGTGTADAVVRCHTCEAVLEVVVHAKGRYHLGLRA